MSAADLLAELRSSGARVEARGDRLHVEARPGTLTRDLLGRLAANKPAILALLGFDSTLNRLIRLAKSAGLPESVATTIPAEELPLYAEFDDADLLLPLHLRARSLGIERGTP